MSKESDNGEERATLDRDRLKRMFGNGRYSKEELTDLIEVLVEIRDDQE